MNKDNDEAEKRAGQEKLKSQKIQEGEIETAKRKERARNNLQEFLERLRLEDLNSVDDFPELGYYSQEDIDGVDIDKSLLIKRAKYPYEVITDGEMLIPEAKAKAIELAKKQGLKIYTKKEFFSEERVAQTEKTKKMSQMDSTIIGEWNKLSDSEKNKYGESKDENDRSRIRMFAAELDKKRLDLEGNGIKLNRESYYQMIKDGLNPAELKIKTKRAWFVGKKSTSVVKTNFGAEISVIAAIVNN